jgi:uncharacterized protein
MNQGPLTEEEIEWLDDVLLKHATERSIMDVAEMDGMLTAILSGPKAVGPEVTFAAFWGGEGDQPHWDSEDELKKFVGLTFKHVNDIAERLSTYPEQYEPLFGTSEVEGQELTIVEEWCFGYMRGAMLWDVKPLPDELAAILEPIALHGLEEKFDELEGMSPEAFIDSIERIKPAVLATFDYWLSRQPTVH